MEHKKHTSLKLAVAGIIAALGISSCTTTYDAYGRPVDSVDPAAVAVGAAVVGLAAYSMGKNSRSSDRHYHRHRGHYHGHRGHYHPHRRYR